MKKKLPIILLGVILACVLVFGFLYAGLGVPYLLPVSSRVLI